MRLVNTKAHAIVDYLLGIVLILSGWFFHFRGQHPATTVAACAGVLAIVSAALTQFELGIFHVISLRTHIAIDVIAGFFLALSPWLLSFDHQAFKPHLVFGLTQAGIGIFSDRVLWTEVKHKR